MINWPLLPYPGNEPQCIGYCPLNCGWEEPECPKDCAKEQEEYFAKTKNEIEKKFLCYHSNVVQEIVETGRELPEVDAFIKDVNSMIEKSREQGEDAFPDTWKMIPSLKIYAGKAEDGSTERHLQRVLISAWVLDRMKIILLTHKVTRKMAIVPNLDGQFGGDPCVRNSDKKRLTIRDSKDEKFDKKTMTNGIPRDQKEFYAVGHFSSRRAKRAGWPKGLKRPEGAFRPFGPGGVLWRRLLHQNDNFVPLAP